MKIKTLLVNVLAMMALILSTTAFASASDCQQCNVCRYSSSNGMLSSQCTNTCDKCHVTDLLKSKSASTAPSGKIKAADNQPAETVAGCQTCHRCLYAGNSQFAPDCSQQCQSCKLPNPLKKLEPKTVKGRTFTNESGMDSQFQTYHQRATSSASRSTPAPVTQADQISKAAAPVDQGDVKPAVGS